MSFRKIEYTIYEIYPESETPHLSQIAHLDRFHVDANFRLESLSGIVIWYRFHIDRIVFIVWDYLLNHSTKFSVDYATRDFFNHKVYFLFF